MSLTDSLPAREEINEEYKWDLSSVYANEEEWETEFEQVTKDLDKIEEYKGELSSSAQVLQEALDLIMDISRRLSRLSTYAQRKYDEDTTKSKYQGLVSRVQSLANDFSSRTSFINPEILQLSRDKLEEFLAENEDLKLYEHYLNDIFRQQEHYLSPEEERILALAGDVTQGPGNIFKMLNNADFEFPTIENEAGQEIEVTHGRYVQLLKNPNRNLRRNAFKAYYKQYQEQTNTMAATLSTSLKKDVFYQRARRYDSSLKAALADDNIPVEVYNNLLSTVEDNLPSLHDYIKLKKDELGVEEFHIYDLYTPLVPEVDFKVEYEQAQEIILEALESLGEEYLAVIKKAFAEDWIDVFENKGKRSGAYSAGCYDAHPYILLNYTGEIDDLFTLAHELGHAVHSYFSSQAQPYVYSNYSIFVAEVASTVNESLLIKHLLKQTEAEAKRKYLLNHYLEQFRGTVYRQTMFADFEKELHQRAEAGKPLTPEILSSRYQELNEKYYGPTLEVDEEIAVEWARIPHFYYNFYVYQYATGFSAAVALAEKILKEGQTAVSSYKKFLKGGSAQYPLDLLREAGVEMTKPDPIESALEVFAANKDQLKELSASS